MKISSIVFIACMWALATHVCVAQDAALVKAYNGGAVARIVGCVVDEENMPVSNATVCASFRSTVRTDDNHDVQMKTKEDGSFEVARRTNWKVECVVSKDGYYDSKFEVSFYDMERNRVDKGHWVNDDLKRKIVIRKIRTKKSLSVFPEFRRMGTWKIPVMNEWIGFDFELYDWAAPHGSGIHRDVLLRFSARKLDHIRGHYQMEVSFTNNPYAGAYVGKADLLSELRIPHVAEMSRDYAKSFCFLRNALGVVREDTFPGKDDYFVFRTRTRTDSEGRLISACYGVISGVWVSGETTMRIEDAAFNLNENDVSIEDGYYLRQVLRQYEGRCRIAK